MTANGWPSLLSGVGMSNGTASSAFKSEDLASIPMARGGLTRLAISHLTSAGVPLGPVLKRSGLTPELVADPEERLNVRSQIAFLNEAASALKDDCLGFTLARDHDPRDLGLLYYVMASSQTLGEALKRLARYSKVTNEALVFGYREGNRLIINLSYSGVPRHSDRHQIEFCMFAALRICRLLNGTEHRATALFVLPLSIGRHLRNDPICWDESKFRFGCGRVCLTRRST